MPSAYGQPDTLLPTEQSYSIVRFDESVPPDHELFATKLAEVDDLDESPDEWKRSNEELVVYDEVGRIIKRTDGPAAPSVLF
ncbi:hypothetical protein HFX_2263 [Haloferax mediterranei ATCC 33500]|uniref:Uncharacterized protein n=1 Tax=Haloferax mediterranei (strain ATCC 33500 / DSM 1411 / JCM 8866 / NBRC 14739 / NCIMB 2177 / R-4) TaxID=523841 RepID=I3R6U1_HALMT|nr:hypothetical protein [Haloferax mediterranei]AFK19951.1 hypothetical protein HFX_2263 [Haloferax mediterranei ATCC 33500]AHZ23327.1 hypothetical protein BM92_12060 [Haloferax mediterranei ATCC 33500]